MKPRTRLTRQQVSWGRKQQHGAAAVQPVCANLHSSASKAVQCMLIVAALYDISIGCVCRCSSCTARRCGGARWCDCVLRLYARFAFACFASAPVQAKSCTTQCCTPH